MALSRKYTAQQYFDQGARDLQHSTALTQTELHAAAKFMQAEKLMASEQLGLVNRSIDAVIALFYDLMSNAYMTPVTILPDTTGRFSSSGTGTWTAATRRLTFATMNTNFGSGDVGKTVMFRVGALVYIGQVSAFVSTTVVEVSGNNLPATDQTVDYVLLASSTPTGNVVSISDLPLMRLGMPIKLELESTVTQTVDAISVAEVRTFVASASKNQNRIVWAYAGEELLLAKGSALTSYGTFTLRYPRVPTNVTAMTDKVDLPDGPALELGIMKLTSLLARRLDIQMPDMTGTMSAIVNALYRSFQVEASNEAIVEKVKALQ